MMKKRTENEIRAELASLKAQLAALEAKPKKKRNGFKSGSGCYTCESCTRLTRDTGEQSIGCRLCPDCWEIAGYANMLGDYGQEELVDYHSAIRSHLKNIVTKGGKFDSDAEALAELVGFSK